MLYSQKGEVSLFLSNRASDSVHWHVWGSAAFRQAKEQNKPVYVFVGYSESHWCQVMARESFRSRDVADLLNHRYIPVLVDRDLHPEAESVSIRICTLLTGSAGWPMNLIFTPEGKPFFASSYLPRDNEHSRMGLISLLSAVADKWERDPAELTKTAEEVTVSLNRSRNAVGRQPDPDFLFGAADQLKASFDEEYGGFGKGAKFPAPQNLLFLLRHGHLTNDRSCREIADKTLQQMYRGGIYDHFGGGFCRSSADREWLKPNFEKLLAENALLAYTYTEAWQDGRYTLYRTVAENTLDYCLRELKSETGGFFNGQDSDTSGMEGVYYLFTPSEVRKVLGEDNGRHFCECYDITEEGNMKGRSIPNLLLNNRWRLIPEGYDNFREKLRLFREERCSLPKNSTVTVSANGMMLMALAKAASCYSDPRYLSEAKDLASFLCGTLLDDTGTPAHCSSDGLIQGSGTLEDHVFLSLGLLELYAASFDAALLCTAVRLADRILDCFADAKGGYRDCISDPVLPIGGQTVFDNACPSGNSAACHLFEKLGRITGELRYLHAYRKLAEYLASRSQQYPAGCSYALCAAEEQCHNARTILCVSSSSHPELLNAVVSRYAPEISVLLKTPSSSELLAACAPWTAECSCTDVPRFYLYTDGQLTSLS